MTLFSEDEVRAAFSL